MKSQELTDQVADLNSEIESYLDAIKEAEMDMKVAVEKRIELLKGKICTHFFADGSPAFYGGKCDICKEEVSIEIKECF